MKQTLLIRLVDITMLLLLSLMTVASIDPYSITLPRSESIDEEGSMPSPLSVAVTADGSLLVLDATGALTSITPEALAAYASETGQDLELVADRQALASVLLELHRTFETAGVRAVFLVQRTSS